MKIHLCEQSLNINASLWHEPVFSETRLILILRTFQRFFPFVRSYGLEEYQASIMEVPKHDSSFMTIQTGVQYIHYVKIKIQNGIVL